MMLSTGLLALAVLAADPAPVAWPWYEVTPVRHYRRHHQPRRRHHPRPAEPPPDCAKINEAVRKLHPDALRDRLEKSTPQQKATIEKCAVEP